MIRFIPLFLWITIALTSVGCSGTSKIDLGRTLTSGRDGWQHPERVVASLEIRKGDRVAEIGAGSGYWLARLSDAVGSEGRVYAVEVEPDLVAALEKRVAKEGFTNVEVILGAYDDPRLPDGEIDLAMTCLTYHHIDDKVTYFRALKHDLSPDGRVVHLDDRPDSPPPISWFQAEGHWTDPDAIVGEMSDAGYSRSQTFDFLPAQSFQIFSPGTAHAENHLEPGA
jgi:ubiquinone/menaquinone biosynthesis C-methylase UbiE